MNRLSALVTAFLGLCTVLAGPSALAGDRPFDVWRSSDSAGHYFRHDYGSNTWVETIDCETRFTFTLNATYAGAIRLYDASRNLYVQLDGSTMWLYPNGATSWTRYRNGGFDKRYLFGEGGPQGEPKGWLNLENGCVWQETLTGGGFTFRETSATPGSILMYDTSRNLYVRLDDTTMWLRTGGNGTFNFFKYGSWE